MQSAVMLRVARLDTPGLLHHVMIRGIARRRIFNDNEDREILIERLPMLLPKTKTQCYAWVFMPNHALFLFRSGPSDIATLMKRLLIGYAVSYNRKHRRHGQLFQSTGRKGGKGRGLPTGIAEILNFKVIPHKRRLGSYKLKK